MLARDDNFGGIGAQGVRGSLVTDRGNRRGGRWRVDRYDGSDISERSRTCFEFGGEDFEVVLEADGGVVELAAEVAGGVFVDELGLGFP